MRYDPLPWLMAQNGLSAVRARRMIDLHREGDAELVHTLVRDLIKEQKPDGSFACSPLKTAGTLNLLDDLKADDHETLTAAGVSYLFSVLAAQPGYERADDIRPGSLWTPCDLGGFFGPYEMRNQSEMMALGAREMNFYRTYEPLLGPKSPVRGKRRSNLDRAGPASCYSWGLIPLSYIIEALCCAGYDHDERLQPAINALLGAQRESGGWCRNLGGHPNCTLHAIHALGAHPALRETEHAERALDFVLKTCCASGAKSNRFAVLQVIGLFDHVVAQRIIREILAELEPRQRKNGTFGGPNRVERVAVVVMAEKALGG